MAVSYNFPGPHELHSLTEVNNFDDNDDDKKEDDGKGSVNLYSIIKWLSFNDLCLIFIIVHFDHI